MMVWSWRRTCATGALVVVLIVGLTSCGPVPTATGTGVARETTSARVLDPETQKVADIVDRHMKEQDLTGAVYGVWRGDELIATGAAGDSPIGVPAT